MTLMRMDAGPRHGADRRAWSASRSTAPRRRRSSRRTSPAVAADLLVRSLGPWISRRARAATRSPRTASTLTRPLRREDGRLDPARSAAELERTVRAYLPWPGTFLEVDGERLVVTAASRRAVGARATSPGVSCGEGDRPALATADGRLVLDAVTSRRDAAPMRRRGLAARPPRVTGLSGLERGIDRRPLRRHPDRRGPPSYRRPRTTTRDPGSAASRPRRWRPGSSSTATRPIALARSSTPRGRAAETAFAEILTLPAALRDDARGRLPLRHRPGPRRSARPTAA